MPSKPTPSTPVPRRPPRKKVSVSMPKALLAEMDAIAKEVGLSRSDVIVTLLHASLPPDPTTPRACPRGFRRPFDP